MHPSETQIADLKAKHSGIDLHLLSYSDGAVVAKHPSRAEWKRFVSVASNDKTKVAQASEIFVRAHVVWPEPAQLERLFEERAALCERLADKLASIAGAEEEISAKKL